MSLDRELTGIVFAINLHPAGGQVVLYKIIIIIMITFLITIISTMTIIVNNKFFFQKRTLSVAWSYRTFGKHERGISSFSQQGFTGLADCIFQHKKALVSKITSGISDGHISNDLPYPRPLKAGESSSTQTRVVHPSGRVLQE